MGSYGFVRFSLPLFPDASVYFLIPVATICIIMVIYAAMIAYAQEDMKQVIALPVRFLIWVLLCLELLL